MGSGAESCSQSYTASQDASRELGNIAHLNESLGAALKDIGAGVALAPSSLAELSLVAREQASTSTQIAQNVEVLSRAGGGNSNDATESHTISEGLPAAV
jgi:methyl-accepting chemotaxis protein